MLPSLADAQIHSLLSFSHLSFSSNLKLTLKWTSAELHWCRKASASTQRLRRLRVEIKGRVKKQSHSCQQREEKREPGIYNSSPVNVSEWGWGKLHKLNSFKCWGHPENSRPSLAAANEPRKRFPLINKTFSYCICIYLVIRFNNNDMQAESATSYNCWTLVATCPFTVIHPKFTNTKCQY